MNRSGLPNVRYQPTYHFEWEVPADPETFFHAQIAAEKILSVERNCIEQRMVYAGIPCKYAAIPEDFKEAIPDTPIQSLDINFSLTVPFEKGGTRFNFHDTRTPARVLQLKELAPRIMTRMTRPGDYAVLDNYPERAHPSQPIIAREVVNRFAAAQKYGRPEVRPVRLEEEQDLLLYLGKAARNYRQPVIVGEVDYSDTQALHTEKKTRFFLTRAGLRSPGVAYSTWLTGELHDEALGLAEGVRVRTLAVTDGSNPANPNNHLLYQVDAVHAHEPDELTQLLARTDRRRIARLFKECLRDYLQRPAETDLTWQAALRP
ncbi:MAG TPA: hypothetical protein VFH39_02300 [Candidatus Saccharimonadales bacterium]|nr:hypothetical protein [Candidatus Saccharimonadales bacterium]